MFRQLFAYTSNLSILQKFILPSQPFILIMGNTSNTLRCELTILLGRLKGSYIILKDLVEDTVGKDYGHPKDTESLKSLFMLFSNFYEIYIRKLQIKAINSEPHEQNYSIILCQKCFQWFNDKKGLLIKQLNTLRMAVYTSSPQFIEQYLTNMLPTALNQFMDGIMQKIHHCQTMKIETEIVEPIMKRINSQCSASLEKQFQIFHAILSSMSQTYQYQSWIKTIQGLMEKNKRIYKNVWKQGIIPAVKIRNQEVIRENISKFTTTLNEKNHQLLIFESTPENMRIIRKLAYLQTIQQKKLFKAKRNMSTNAGHYINYLDEYSCQFVQYNMAEDVFTSRYLYDILNSNQIMQKNENSRVSIQKNLSANITFNQDNKTGSSQMQFGSSSQLPTRRLESICHINSDQFMNVKSSKYNFQQLNKLQRRGQSKKN